MVIQIDQLNDIADTQEENAEVAVQQNGLTFKELFEKIGKYGGLLSIQAIIAGTWTQSEIQVIGLLESPEWVTGFSISRHYSSLNGLFLTSLSFPLQYTKTSSAILEPCKVNSPSANWYDIVT